MEPNATMHPALSRSTGFSLFVHVVVCVGTPFLWLNDSPLRARATWVYPLTGRPELSSPISYYGIAPPGSSRSRARFLSTWRKPSPRKAKPSQRPVTSPEPETQANSYFSCFNLMEPPVDNLALRSLVLLLPCLRNPQALVLPRVTESITMSTIGTSENRATSLSI